MTEGTKGWIVGLLAGLVVVIAVMASPEPLKLRIPGFDAELAAQQTFDAGRVTVATTATVIFTAPSRGATVRICNRHTTSIFIGPATVTTANGFEVLNATCEIITPFRRSAVYGIVAAATARVDFFVHEYPR